MIFSYADTYTPCCLKIPRVSQAGHQNKTLASKEHYESDNVTPEETTNPVATWAQMGLRLSSWQRGRRGVERTRGLESVEIAFTPNK